MSDCTTSNQSSTRMKNIVLIKEHHNGKKGQVWYRNTPVMECSGTVMLQCQTEMPDAGIPILAAFASILMSSYVQHAKNLLTTYQCWENVSLNNNSTNAFTTTVMLQCQTEMPDAGIPILAAFASILMSSYVQHAKNLLKTYQCWENVSLNNNSTNAVTATTNTVWFLANHCTILAQCQRHNV